MMLEAFYVGIGAALGFAIARWWAIVLAVPAGLFASERFDFEGFSASEESVLVGFAIAAGIVVGVTLRKIAARLLHQSPDRPPDRSRRQA